MVTNKTSILELKLLSFFFYGALQYVDLPNNYMAHNWICVLGFFPFHRSDSAASLVRRTEFYVEQKAIVVWVVSIPSLVLVICVSFSPAHCRILRSNFSNQIHKGNNWKHNEWILYFIVASIINRTTKIRLLVETVKNRRERVKARVC